MDAAAWPIGLTRSGRHPAPPDAPFYPLPAPSPSPLASAAAAAATAVAPLLAELRRSPPAAPVSHSPRRDHRRARLRRGKPLRMLHQGESHPRARNRSPDFPRPRRSTLPRRNPLISASFRLILSALGSGRGEEARTIPRARSTPPEWPGHGEQHRHAAMHASRALRSSSGQTKDTLGCASLRGETSLPTRCARWRCSPSRSR